MALSGRWRRLALPLLLLIGAGSAAGAVTPQEAVRDARTRAGGCFSRGAFAAAIPDFEQAAQRADVRSLNQALLPRPAWPALLQPVPAVLV